MKNGDFCHSYVSLPEGISKLCLEHILVGGFNPSEKY